MLNVFLIALITTTVPPCGSIQDEKNDVLPLQIDTLSFFGYRSFPCALNMQLHINSRIA